MATTARPAFPREGAYVDEPRRRIEGHTLSADTDEELCVRLVLPRGERQPDGDDGQRRQEEHHGFAAVPVEHAERRAGRVGQHALAYAAAVLIGQPRRQSDPFGLAPRNNQHSRPVRFAGLLGGGFGRRGVAAAGHGTFSLFIKRPG